MVLYSCRLLFDKHLSFFDGIKYLAVKHLIPQLAIEIFIIPILPPTTYLNIQGPCSDTAQPVTHCFSCKLIMIEGGVSNGSAFLLLYVVVADCLIKLQLTDSKRKPSSAQAVAYFKKSFCRPAFKLHPYYCKILFKPYKLKGCR